MSRFTFAFTLVACSAAYGWSSEQVFIELASESELQVRLLDGTEAPDRPGVLVYSEHGVQRARPVGPGAGGETPIEGDGLLSQPARGEANAVIAASAGVAVPLDQLLMRPLYKGRGFITPDHNGFLLDPKLVIRREPNPGPQPFPATELSLKRDGREVLRIPVRAGQSKVAWDELKDVPANWKAGLPAGQYVLADTGESSKSVAFEIVDADERDFVRYRTDELQRLLKPEEDSLLLTFTVQNLLSQRDAEGKPRRYVTDAINLLERQEPKRLTKHLRAVLKRLLQPPEPDQGDVESQTTPTADSTGITSIDQARELLARGSLAEAKAILDREAQSEDRRIRGLALLYTAVLLAESGPSQALRAEMAFGEAIGELTDGPPEDEFRAVNNYAGYLLGRTQDRLFNHAFQAAAGLDSPLIESFRDWQLAREQFERAGELADKLTPGDRAVAKINLAKLHALLADLLRSLPQGSKLQERMLGVAEKRSGDMAREIIGSPDTPAAARSAAQMILAQIAFRQGRFAEADDSLNQAWQLYADDGALLELEALHRLRGLKCQAQARQQSDERLLREAQRQLLISQTIAESIREQLPRDQINVSRTGYFSRRAYVPERLLELHLALGEVDKAFECAEMVKARSLQDVLLSRSSKALADVGQRPGIRSTNEILQAWPKGVAALEYFIGTERAWVFFVSPAGTLTAHEIKAVNGEPLSSTALIGHLRRTLTNLEGQSRKMLQRLLAGKGYDHTWQDDFHELYGILIPKTVRADLAAAKLVVVVPHHVLHYFPMAALVTVPDRKDRGKSEMVSPQFLLDSPFDLVYSPSLAVWDLQRQEPARQARGASAMGVVEVPGHTPLPGVEKDLGNYRAAFGEQVRTVREGNESNEACAKQLLLQPDVVLFATHGFNDPDAPLESFLLLMPEASEDDEVSDPATDGRLTAEEIYAVPMRANLIVMSACYSGLGDRSPLPGDDLFGLQRAFLQAGVQTVLSGLWDVYDGTAPDLMNRFFQRLQAGEGTAAALAGAQRSFLADLRKSEKSEPYLHPYFWAVYTVAGDDRTTVAPAGAGTERR